jgi:tartrate dehydratase beta subunit/fumarate hydratase class I family protein
VRSQFLGRQLAVVVAVEPTESGRRVPYELAFADQVVAIGVGGRERQLLTYTEIHGIR